MCVTTVKMYSFTFDVFLKMLYVKKKQTRGSPTWLFATFPEIKIQWSVTIMVRLPNWLVIGQWSIMIKGRLSIYLFNFLCKKMLSVCLNIINCVESVANTFPLEGEGNLYDKIVLWWGPSDVCLSVCYPLISSKL